MLVFVLFFYSVHLHVWPFTYLLSVPFLSWPFAYVFPYVCAGAFFAQAKGVLYQQAYFRRIVLLIVWIIGVFNICMWRNSFVLVLSIWLTTLAFPNIYVPQWLSGLLPYTMGIYMVHLIFTWISNMVLHALGYELFPFWTGWVVGVICFAGSWIMVRLLRKIPYCSYIV